MFLTKDFILANEIVQKANIHIANISNFLNHLEETNNKAGISKKMGNCSFINNTSPFLPHNIKEYIDGFEYTDMSDKLPSTFLASEFELSSDKILQGFNKVGYDVHEEVIAGKRFLVFPLNFIEAFEGKTWYILDYEEAVDCFDNEDIEDFFPLYKNKMFCWY